MRTAFSACLIALAMMLLPAVVPIPQSVAQAPEREAPPVSKINITVEQRHVIREVIKDLAVAKAPADAKVTTGSSAPSEAVLRSFPPEISDKVPQIKSHKFFVNGDQIVIVSPDGNDIVEIIE